jgi:predicted esterase
MKPTTIIAVLLIVFALILVYVNVIQPKVNAEGTIQTITCSDKKHTYALYLPKNFNKYREYRVLFCFDPGGNGQAAVDQFKYAGEKYNWILVGSNDARNGPWKDIGEAQDAIFKDIQERYKVDNRNFCAVGFSGGARMSYTMAYNHPENFKGVIACGAGFGLGTINKNIIVYHCVGETDENLDEVKDAYNQLKRLGVNTKLNVFKGGHQWPPTAVKTNAVDWLTSW